MVKVFMHFGLIVLNLKENENLMFK